MRHSFRFSGTGGQGLITAGIILAEAALLDDKLSSVMSPFTSAVLSARILCW